MTVWIQFKSSQRLEATTGSLQVFENLKLKMSFKAWHQLSRDKGEINEPRNK